MEKILITICGRAGSKGFKNKNLKTLLGVPLVYYTLTCANYLKDNVKDAEVDICVNTDSEDLIALAESYGSELHVIRRPEELCGDVVDKVKVFRHSLHTMEDRLGKTYDYLIDIRKIHNDLVIPIRLQLIKYRKSKICKGAEFFARKLIIGNVSFYLAE